MYAISALISPALGVTYLQLKRNADAVGAISKAIRLNPNQPTYYNNLAAAYAEMARWQDAFNTLNVLASRMVVSW